MKAIRGQKDKGSARKVVAYALAGAMAFGIIPTVAFATDETQGQSVPAQPDQPSSVDPQDEEPGVQEVNDSDMAFEEDGIERTQETEVYQGEDGPSMTVQSEEATSGTWGNCPWEIDGEGKLTIHPCAEGVDQQELVVIEAPWKNTIASFTSIEFASENNRKVVMGTSAENLFGDLSRVVSIDLSGLDTSSVTNMRWMFGSCTSLSSLKLEGFDTSSVTNMGWMFHDCSSLESIDLSNFNTSQATTMESMFDGCTSLASLDLSTFNTANVADMGGMFSGCQTLGSLDISGFSMSSNRRMAVMFAECSSLQTLDLTGVNTSDVEIMSGVFRGCSSLRELDVSGFNTKNVRTTNGMFSGCESLKTIDVSGFDTTKVENIGGMFKGCSSLESLDLSSFDTTKVDTAKTDPIGYPTYATNPMFEGCASLATLTLGNGYEIKGEFMVPDANVNEGWWSVADNAWYSKDEIMTSRSKVADTYRTTKLVNIAGVVLTGLRSCAYDGAEHRLVPTVRVGDDVLAAGTDFDVVYYRNGKVTSDLKSAGKITVRVSGKGEYTGKAWGTYDIWKNGQPMDAWAVVRQAPATSMKARDVVVEAPIHVTHAVSAGKPMEYRKVGGDSRLNVELATGRVTVRKGTPAGTYKVKIRAIAFGGANYADGSRTVECYVQVVPGKIDQDFQASASEVSRTAASLAGSDYLTRPFSTSGAQGSVSYKRASGSGCLDVDSSGRLKVARGTKAGTYYVKAWVTSAGDAGYNTCTRTVTVKVVVK